MQMQHVFTFGAFVQIINVLGDNLHIELFFQFFQAQMRGIRLFAQHLLAPHVVKFDNLFAVIVQRIRRANLFNAVIRPKPIARPKRSNTGLCTNS